MAIPLAVPIIASAAAGTIGALGAQSGRNAAARQRELAVQAWLDLNVPNPEDQRLILERFRVTGELDPEIEEAVQRSGTAFDQIALDPGTRERQLRALDALSELGSAGMTPEEEAALTDSRIAIDSRDRGRREAIADSFARRGLTGSGVELISQLSGAEAAQQAEAKATRDKMAEARRRALDSIIAGGRLAGDVRQADYAIERDRAGARDSVSDFNARMLAGTRERNVDRRNDARRYNLDRAQQVADRNTQLTNDETKWNQIGRYQQAFDNNARVTQGRANAYMDQGTATGSDANANAQMWGNFAAGIGQTAATLATRGGRGRRRSTDWAGYDDADEHGGMA